MEASILTPWWDLAFFAYKSIYLAEFLTNFWEKNLQFCNFGSRTLRNAQVVLKESYWSVDFNGMSITCPGAFPRACLSQKLHGESVTAACRVKTNTADLSHPCPFILPQIWRDISFYRQRTPNPAMSWLLDDALGPYKHLGLRNYPQQTTANISRHLSLNSRFAFLLVNWLNWQNSAIS